MDIVSRLAIRRLVDGRAEVVPLEQAKAPSPILAKTSIGAKSVASSGTSGVASPLTETARSTYITKSTDGIMSWSVPSQIDFIDAEGREVSFVFNQP